MNNNICNLETVNKIATFIEANTNYKVEVGTHSGTRKAVGLCITNENRPIGFLNLTANNNYIMYDTGRLNSDNSLETAILPTNITLLCNAAVTFFERLRNSTCERVQIAA